MTRNDTKVTARQLEVLRFMAPRGAGSKTGRPYTQHESFEHFDGSLHAVRWYDGAERASYPVMRVRRNLLTNLCVKGLTRVDTAPGTLGYVLTKRGHEFLAALES